MPDLKIVQFPGGNLQEDIPAGLRSLADSIEQGEAVHNIAYVMDYGDNVMALGLLGGAAEPGAVSHLLFAVAQRRLEGL